MLVGFGRFGRAIAEVLDRRGIEWKAFDPASIDDPDGRLLHGEHTESILRDAGIADRRRRWSPAPTSTPSTWAPPRWRGASSPEIFVVIRQNQMQDRALIEAARANLTFVQSDLMVHECLQLLKTPMLGRFIAQLRAGDRERGRGDARAHARAKSATARRSAWTFECDVMQPGMFAAFFQRVGRAVPHRAPAGRSDQSAGAHAPPPR